MSASGYEGLLAATVTRPRVQVGMKGLIAATVTRPWVQVGMKGLIAATVTRSWVQVGMQVYKDFLHWSCEQMLIFLCFK